MGFLRLDKIIAVAKNISRNDAAKIISKGDVMVNDTIIKSAAFKADSEKDSISVNHKPINFQQNVYILMNKPVGIVSSSDNRDGQTVLELLPEHLSRKGLFIAGRLDKYSEGMVIITDDGDFSHRMLSPKSHVAKTYYVEVDAPIMTEELKTLFSKGIFLGDGQYSSPAQLRILSDTTANVTIHEGIYHQVRRMFDKNGGKVTKLVRIAIGNLPFDAQLSLGESRLLNESEQLMLLEKDI